MLSRLDVPQPLPSGVSIRDRNVDVVDLDIFVIRDVWDVWHILMTHRLLFIVRHRPSGRQCTADDSRNGIVAINNGPCVSPHAYQTMLEGNRLSTEWALEIAVLEGVQ